jgi:hypothetical protein
MGYDYDRDDPSFIKDLRDSKVAVQVATQWLNSKGYAVIVRPTFIRPSAEQMSDFSDDGDLEILQRIEVKRRQSLTFTSKEDFPYKTAIVDACHCYDNAKPKPYAYIIFNRDLSGAFIVDVKATRQQWVRVTKRDRFKNRDRDFYEVSTDLVSFEVMSLDESLKGAINGDT